MSKLNNDDIKRIVFLSCQKLNMTPNETSVRNIVNFVRKYDISFLNTKVQNRNELYEYLSDIYTNTIKNANNEEDIVTNTTNQYIKDTLYDTSYKEFKKINRNDWSNWNSTYIYIDSRYQDISNTDRSILDFSIIPKSNVSRSRNGNIVSYSNLTNVTEFELGEFIIPYNSSLNYFREITLMFLDIPNNSIDTNENSFHFKFSYEPCSFNQNLIKLVPYQRIFRFNPPIKTLDKLRIQFADPYVPIQFLKDRMKPTTIFYNQPDIEFIFSEAHNLYTGDVVIVEGLTTTNANENIEALKKINDERGHAISVVNQFSFTISNPLFNIINPSANSKPFIYFQSRRIQFPMRIRYINNEDIF